MEYVIHNKKTLAVSSSPNEGTKATSKGVKNAASIRTNKNIMSQPWNSQLRKLTSVPWGL